MKSVLKNWLVALDLYVGAHSSDQTNDLLHIMLVLT